MGAGYEGIIISLVLSNIIMIIQMCARTKIYDLRISISEIKCVVTRYKEYVLFQYPSNLLGNTAEQVPTQLLWRLFDNAIVGSYTMCTNVLQYPVKFIASPISTTYFRTVNEYRRDGKSIADFTYKLITRIMLASVVPIIIVSLWGQSIIVFALGEKWSEAGNIATFLIAQYCLLFCTQCTAYCRVSLGYQKLNLVYNIVNVATTFLCLVIGYLAFGTLVGTLLVFTIGKSAVYIFDMALNFKCMKKNTMKYILFATIYLLTIYLLQFSIMLI
jgi:O-antigen/teichoic acid export membrane protein